MMKRPIVWHPLLIGLFPVLTLLSHNLREMDPIGAVPLAGITLAMALILLWVCQLFLRDILRAGVIVSGFLIFFFSPIHVFLTLRVWLAENLGEHMQLTAGPVFVVWTLALLWYVYFFSKKAKGLTQLTAILNVSSVCLVAIPVYNIATAKLSERIDWSGIHKQQQAEPVISKTTPDPLPDIYYIVMDRYAGPGTLKTNYGFDNREFLDYLDSKGFYVAAQSAANYPSTAHSLASTLNLQYINYTKSFVEPESTSWIPIQRLLHDHKLMQLLKSEGYKYIHLGSWWEPTRKNRFADDNILFNRFPENVYVLFATTMLQPISSALGVLDLRYEHWRGNRRQFENLAKTVEAEGPKFVLAHFLLPHDPYVFSRDGHYMPIDHVSKQPREASYIDQLIYTNRMLQRTIDGLLAKSKRPPIIVLQADEGPWPRRYEDEYPNFDWRQATAAELNQKMKILNSFHLPGVDSRALYPTISPVNTFRVILNLYFKTSLPLLPDESFVYERQRHPYHLSNVTSRLRRD